MSWGTATNLAEAGNIYALIAVGVALLVMLPVVTFCCISRRRVDLAKYPRDKVTLCQLSRGPWAPSISPYPLKLETYLRMARIPYENQFGNTMSSKGKTPWMVYGGEEMADSQLCIEHLNRERGVDLNSGLSDVDRATARAYRLMVEGDLYWVLALYRWKHGVKEPANAQMLASAGIGAVFVRMVGRIISKQADGQGMGRHTRQEVQKIGEADIRALATFLGDKQFLMGSEPCEEDCSLFGNLAQLYWHCPGSPYETLIKGDCANLGEYCVRMKERFWPDWDECITHGGTTEAAK